MKWLLSLAVAAGLAAAAAVAPNAAGPRALRRASRPPRGLDAVTQDIGTPSLVRDKADLVPVPPALAAAPRRTLSRQLTAQDFYECSASTPAPNPSDCTVITDSLLDTTPPQQLIAGGGSCFVFSYQTCTAFFCALCADDAATSTDFIGSQLGTVEALCPAGAGTIVGEDAPQWEVGFVRAGAPLPNYDVC